MKKVLVIFGFTLCCLEIFAQKDTTKIDTTRVVKSQLSLSEHYKKYLPNFSPLSPNATAMQKYGDYSVSMEKGLVDISIPIYTVQEGNLSLPIVLRNHASGHSLFELASWVGWGWSLDFGGMVNRTINGLADDKNIAKNYLKTAISPWNLCNNINDYTNAQNVNNASYDLEPDLFTYSTPEVSGKFYLRQAGQPPLLIPYQPIKISHDYVTANTLKTFQVVAPSGNAYVFGGDDAQEYQSVMGISGDLSLNGTATWNLTKILSPNTDDAILLSYQDGGSITQSSISSSASATFQNGSPVSFSTNPVQNISARTNTARNIHKITFPNGEIEFIQSTVSERLDLSNSPFLKEINIYNYENSVKILLKKFVFRYSYFLDRTGANGRLKLDKLVEFNSNSTDSLVHSFSYSTNSYSWQTNEGAGASSVDYLKQDYFGYFNGKNNNHLIDIASYNGVAILDGVADRSTVSTYMKEGVLSKINYPTGGFTTFDFEVNKYKQLGIEKFAGGLRIKELRNFTGTGSLAFAKRYEYGSEDGVGIGKLTNSWSSPSSSMVGYINSAVGDQLYRTEFIGSNGMVEMGSFEGTPIYYPIIKEFTDVLGQSNGYSEYQFSFEPDISVITPSNFVRDIEPWKRGLLLSHKSYNSVGVLVQNIINTYQEFKQQFITNIGRVNQINDNPNFQCPMCASGMFNGYVTSGGLSLCDYPEFNYFTGNNKTGQMKLVSSLSVLDGISTTESIVYDDYLLPIQKTINDSQNNVFFQKTSVYPTNTSYDSDPEVIELRTRNMIGITLEDVEKEDRKGIIINLFKQKTVYERFTGANARGLNQNILPKEIWLAPKGEALEKRVTFTDYASNGNPLGYVVDDMPISLVWGYNDALLLAEIKNATKSQTDAGLSTAGITATGMSSTELSSGQLSQLQSLRNALPNAFVSWYSYRPQVGLSNMVSSNGLVSRFAYDKLNRLQSIKDHSSYLTDLYNYVYATTAPTGCTPPDAPSITVSSSNLCDATLTASGCAGIINWSNGGAGASINVLTKTSTTYTATCTVDGCTSSASSGLAIPVLPSGWSSADIGSASGCTQNNYGTPPAGALALQGSGNVGGSDDSFHWIYKSMSGDFTMIVKINSLPVVNGQRSGIMIRSNTNSNAQFYTLIQDGNENVGELKRDTNGGTGGLYSFAGSAANQTWIKVVKTGTSIKGYHSTNSNPEANNAWNDYFNLTGNAPTTLDFGSNYLIGLVTYGSSNQTTFTNITLNGNAF